VGNVRRLAFYFSVINFPAASHKFLEQTLRYGDSHVGELKRKFENWEKASNGG
jgi:hypothetical protein